MRRRCEISRVRAVGLATLVLVAGGLSTAGGPAWANPRALNGFVLEPADIEPTEILGGGPPRDGIPALDEPTTAGPDYAWSEDELVIGVEVDGAARAYPISILVWHELVNDEVGGRPILVSYCPLCGTGMVFDRRVGEGAPRRFGVSGLLYRSDLLMFDRKTESLWSQIEAVAVTGPARGERLSMLRSQMVPWKRWRAEHPHTTVVTRETGHRRDYGRSPYGDYARSERLFFPVPADRRYHPKMPTVGLRRVGGGARAYPAVEVLQAGGVIEESFEGHAVRVAWDDESQTFDVRAPAELEVVQGFWFAWAAFHPETSVAKAAAAAAEPAGISPQESPGATGEASGP